MKNYFKLIKLLSASILMALTVAQGSAQANFAVMPVVIEGDITEEAGDVIYRKTEQILTRNSAGAAGAADVFAVEASMNVSGQAKSSGLVREITSVSGEFTLIAINKIDGARYYSVTVPLQAASKGSGTSGAILALANSIKPTDAVYTRFIRIAREKIEEYYSEHCSDILDRARNIGLAGKYEAALTYLTGMPASAPCHDEALELIDALRAKIDQDKAAAEAKAEAKEERRREARERRRAEHDGHKPGRGNEDDFSYADDDCDTSDTVSADTSLGDLYIESPDWLFSVSDARYLPALRKIKITAYVTYVGKDSSSGMCSLNFRNAIDADGNSYANCYVDGNSYCTFPDNVPVKVEYIINDVKSNPQNLSFVGFSVDYKKIEIRNLPISE